jgi:hypothetical protein
MLETQARTAEASAIKVFETRLAEIEAANRAEEKRVMALKRQVEEDQASAFVTQQNALRVTIKEQIDSLLAEQQLAKNELAAVGVEERDRLKSIREEPRRDILTQTLALHNLFEEGAEGGRFAFYTYIILTALFMLVDTIPLVVKFFTKAGPYDTLVDRDEISFDSEHSAFKSSNNRYMENLSEGNLISVTRNKGLESQAGNSIALGVGLLNDEPSLKTFGPLFALCGNRLFQFPNFATHSRLGLSELGSDLFDFRRAILLDDRAYGVAEEKETKRVGDGEAHENRYHETKSKLG